MVSSRASSRLKPVPLTRRSVVGPASAGNASGVTPQMYGVLAGLFPAKASPTDRAPRRTGFSREGVRCHTENLMVFELASSRLKPVLQTAHLVGPASAGKASGVTPQMYGVLAGLFPAKASPTDRAPRGTGFSREGVGRDTANLMVFELASSRLKPVLQTAHLAGSASAGNGQLDRRFHGGRWGFTEHSSVGAGLLAKAFIQPPQQ